MKKVKIPKNRIRKLKTFSLGKKSFELLSLNSQNKKLIDLCSNDYLRLVALKFVKEKIWDY